MLNRFHGAPAYERRLYRLFPLELVPAGKNDRDFTKRLVLIGPAVAGPPGLAKMDARATLLPQFWLFFEFRTHATPPSSERARRTPTYSCFSHLPGLIPPEGTMGRNKRVVVR